MAEYFRDDEHRDVLLLVDNIFRFIQPGMDVSGLPGQMPSLLGYQPTMGTELPGWGRAYCNTDIGPSRPFGQCKCRLTIQPIRFGREVAAKAARIDSVMVEAGGVEPFIPLKTGNLLILYSHKFHLARVFYESCHDLSRWRLVAFGGRG